MYTLLKDFQKLFKPEDIVIDCPTFRINSTLNTLLLSVCSLIAFWTQTVKQPIQCLGDESTNKNFMNGYCYFNPTCLIPEPSGLAHPGVTNDFEEEDTLEECHIYHQSIFDRSIIVCLVLMFQALLCYFPKWLWEFLEGKRMSAIVCGLNTGLVTKEEYVKKKGRLIHLLNKYRNRHNMYVFNYWFCEALCFINIVAQMYVINWFFSGDFMKYGLHVLTFDDEDQANRVDHISSVFPLVTKCIYTKFDPSGFYGNHEALCFLPMNLINEKTYVLIWFWFALLVSLTAVDVIFRVWIFSSPALRFQRIHAPNEGVSEEAALVHLNKHLSVGDWWILYLLKVNVHPQIFTEIIDEFSKRL